MLGKLIKYDMKSMIRQFVPLWILAPVIALMLSFSVRGAIMQEEYSVFYGLLNQGTNIILVIMSLLFFGVMVALTVMTVLLVIQRFWNGLLKEEGYLMFTLPVEPWQLITSKGVTATIVSCVSILVGFFSCMILFLMVSRDVAEAFMDSWTWFWTRNGFDNIMATGSVLILFLLVVILGVAKSIYHVYASMAMGQLFEGHRVVGSCVSYVGISVVFSVITSLFMMIFEFLVPESWFAWMNQDSVLFLHLYLFLMLLLEVVQVLIFHLIADWILKTRLNLE